MSVRWLAVYGLLVVLVVALGVVYVSAQFWLSKGPNDWAAQTHALHLVQAKYGPDVTINTSDYEFRKDTAHPPNGTYVFQYDYAGRKGRVASHYDNATGTFNADIISPAK